VTVAAVSDESAVDSAEIDHSTLMGAMALAVFAWLGSRGLRRPKVADVVREAGVSRAWLYEVKARILDMAPSALRPPGRPARPPVADPDPRTARRQQLAYEAFEYLILHPGAIEGGSARRRYSDAYRRFVLEQRERYPELNREELAAAVHVPLRTLSDWTRADLSEIASEARPKRVAPVEPARLERIESILGAWQQWKGSFSAFCTHVEEHLRIPYRRTLVARILEEHGLRKPRRRPGRSPDERALRDQFETFFPGAQWSADGTPLTVEVAGERFTFNVELVVDTDSDAPLGLSIRDEEDGQAVVDAFEDARQAAGEQPLALLLDNRPSNHTAAVDEALGDTLRMRSTPGRAQNKAHSEGAFGLLAQTAPPLVVPSVARRDVAFAALALVLTTWARTLNHKPRLDRGGRSRAELYRAAEPTAEEVDEARRALEDLVRKQEQARLTLLARQDPVVRRTLEEAFVRLELDDPEGHQRAAIGRYPLDHVLAGIAIYEGKRAAGTLPDGVDARYLLGIVRNLAHEDEGIHVAEALWRARLAARDQILVSLDRQREHDVTAASDSLDLTCRLVDWAMASTRTLDRSFWLRALADAIGAEPEDARHALFRVAARRIHATHAVPHGERLAATRRLAAMVLPVG
jgi:hypothetical protein